jgi:serine/threonine-protein kinase
MRVTLVVTEGPHQGKQFSFSDHQTFLVGRSKRCHFQLPKDDKYFSRVHFMIEVNPPHVALTDMNSRNKTFVNGKEIGQVQLRDGDVIRAGRTVIRVAVAGAAASLPPPAPVLPPPAPPPQVTTVAATPKVPGAGTAATAPLPEPKASVVSLLPDWFNGPSQILKPRKGTCPTCAAPLPAGGEPLCPACRDAAAKMPQPIPGYRIVRELGRGSMGIVSLALREADGAAYALKTIIPSVAANHATLERFLREAHILRQLQHPNIVGLRDEGEVAGVLYFAMDYVHGTDASRLLKRDGPMDVRRALRLVCPMLEALAHAHARQFVHRDVKPSNLLVAEVDGKEVVRLADFGLARVYQASEMSGLTFNGDIGGTVAYMPPEQITEYRDAKPAADQYSAAASLYNLLTGKYVYDLPDGDFQKQLLLILNEEPVPILKRRKDVPKALAEAIHRGLAREPQDRFPGVKVFRESLRTFEG